MQIVVVCLSGRNETTPSQMNTFNCYINGNEIITNGICNENVVLMGKDAAPGHDAAHPTLYKVVPQHETA